MRRVSLGLPIMLSRASCIFSHDLDLVWNVLLGKPKVGLVQCKISFQFSGLMDTKEHTIRFRVIHNYYVYDLMHSSVSFHTNQDFFHFSHYLDACSIELNHSYRTLGWINPKFLTYIIRHNIVRIPRID
jgi:hypothetical protein